MLFIRFGPRTAFLCLLGLFVLSVLLLYPRDFSVDTVVTDFSDAQEQSEPPKLPEPSGQPEAPEPSEAPEQPESPEEPEPLVPFGPPEPRYEGGSLPGPPPTHDAIRTYERILPQHNLDLPFPEGKTGRYVRFNIQPHGQGWNNILNEWYALVRTLYCTNTKVTTYSGLS